MRSVQGYSHNHQSTQHVVPWRAIGQWLVCLMLLVCAHVRAGESFLDPSVAFRLQSSEAPGSIRLTFQVADGYYLYRERFAFNAAPASDSAKQVQLGAPVLPAGKIHFDQTFNKDVETYRGKVPVTIPVLSAAGPFDLDVSYQGCSDKGVCYPPQHRTVHIDGAAAGSGAGAAPSGTDRLYSQDYASSVLDGRSLPAVLGIFFVLGMALSLLPCSLPMIPILSSIILGEGTALTRRRGFGLSLAYVLGMALVYTAFGLIAALAGQSLGAFLQTPWVLGIFALVLTVFALSQLGCYELQLPAAWQSRVSGVSQRLSGGKWLAVFVMGALSALVVGACMTAPLFGVLAFIARTHNVFLGGASLFMMALGMGVPLLIVGLGAGSVLPRAGAWMDGIKRLFGVVLLGAAIWIVAPVLPAALRLLCWALIAALSAVALFGVNGPQTAAQTLFRPATLAWRMVRRALALLAALYAAALLLGAAGGADDPLQPLSVFSAARTGPAAGAQQNVGALAAAGPASGSGLAFATVRNVQQLSQAVHTAGRPSMLFFHADWCTSCVEMERFVFTDPTVQASMARLGLVQADVTANDADDQALLKRFGLFGPPAILFFDAQGKELPTMRVVGYQPSQRFIATLNQVMTAAAGQPASAAASSPAPEPSSASLATILQGTAGVQQSVAPASAPHL